MENLLKIQSELKAPKGQYNSFGKYKYRNCEDILEALKPLLKKHKCVLTLTDEVKEICGVLFTEATATISSEKESVSVRSQAGIDTHKKGMDTAQSFGSSSSYARKYCLNGLFLIDDTKDSDATNKHDKNEEKDIRPKLTSEGFEKAKDVISSGKATLEAIEKKYQVSDAQREQLLTLIK